MRRLMKVAIAVWRKNLLRKIWFPSNGVDRRGRLRRR
jgi:hypothetical protein